MQNPPKWWVTPCSMWSHRHLWSVWNAKCKCQICCICYIMNLGSEGKLTVVTQRMGLLAGIGNFSYNTVGGGNSMQNLASSVAELFIPVLQQEGDIFPSFFALFISVWCSAVVALSARFWVTWVAYAEKLLLFDIQFMRAPWYMRCRCSRCGVESFQQKYQGRS